MSKSNSHNKKRNTGLIYEFLVRTISMALVEGDKKKSSTALKILKRHFKPGTELYKEFRLINSLVKTTVSSDSVAGSILREAKSAARNYDSNELDREKSILIKHINYTLGGDDFYDQQINEYKIYATVQTLLNDWRSKNIDIGRVASYEDQLVRWLTTKKDQPDDHVISEDNAGTSRLLMKIMTKKLNEKYSGLLNEDQRSLVKSYVFSTASDDPEIIRKKLAEIKNVLLERIDQYSDSHDNNGYTNEKLFTVKERLLSESLEIVNDDTVTRFMLYTKLNSEIISEELFK
jgi:hypothetical protein